jgi:hypothetical protein
LAIILFSSSVSGAASKSTTEDSEFRRGRRCCEGGGPLRGEAAGPGRGPGGGILRAFRASSGRSGLAAPSGGTFSAPGLPDWLKSISGLLSLGRLSSSVKEA